MVFIELFNLSPRLYFKQKYENIRNTQSNLIEPVNTQFFFSDNRNHIYKVLTILTGKCTTILKSFCLLLYLWSLFKKYNWTMWFSTANLHVQTKEIFW